MYLASAIVAFKYDNDKLKHEIKDLTKRTHGLQELITNQHMKKQHEYQEFEISLPVAACQGNTKFYRYTLSEAMTKRSFTLQPC